MFGSQHRLQGGKVQCPKGGFSKECSSRRTGFGIRSSGATEKCRTVQHGQCSREPILEGLARFPSSLLGVNTTGSVSKSTENAVRSQPHQRARRLRKLPKRI